MGNTITLIGHPQVFDEKKLRSISEKKEDVYSEKEIVYPDLVFTLRNGKEDYFRPLVRKEKYGFEIFSNPLFVRAIKEVGLKKIKFDLLLDNNLQLEELMEKYHLEFPSPVKRKNYRDTFLFFIKPVKEIPTINQHMKLHSANKSREYTEMHCISYRMFIENGHIRVNTSSEINFINEVVENNGPLRSIDGLIKKFGAYDVYFRT